MRSGLWLEDATTVGVVPAAGTTLLLLPMESVLTTSCERLSGYNATAVSSDSHCGEFRESPPRCGHYHQPDDQENIHTPPRETPFPAGGRHQLKKSTARNTPNPKTHYHHPETPPHHGFQGRDANYNSSANHLNINDTLLLRT